MTYPDLLAMNMIYYNDDDILERKKRFNTLHTHKTTTELLN